MADNSAKIAELRSILQTGVQSASGDGISVTRNLETIKIEIARLEAEDATAQTKRPRAASIYLGGF